MEYRKEHDSMGEILVPADRYWGAQTQRSFDNFRIGTEKIPDEIIRAFSYLKQAAAIANQRLSRMDEERAQGKESLPETSPWRYGRREAAPSPT